MTTDNVMNTGNLENPNDTSVQAFVLSRNPDKAMQEMMETINALRTVYEQENAALDASDTKGFLGLIDRKMAIARDYHAGAVQMLERREEFSKADPDLRKKLLDMQEDFSELSSRNLESLDRMRRSVRRLGDKIMGAAREAVKKDSVNYEASGNLYDTDRSVSLGLNESA